MLDCKTSLKSWQRTGSTFPETGSTETSFPQILVYLRLKVWGTQVAHICIHSYIHVIAAARDSTRGKLCCSDLGSGGTQRCQEAKGQGPGYSACDTSSSSTGIIYCHIVWEYWCHCLKPRMLLPWELRFVRHLRNLSLRVYKLIC